MQFRQVRQLWTWLVLRRRLGVGLADAFVAFLVEFACDFGAAGFDDAAAEHDVRFERDVVFEQLFVVRDNEDAHIGAADFGDALAGEADGVGIETAIGFVENGEFGLQHGELQDFGALHFSAGETIVHIAAGELKIDFELLHFGAKLFPELAHRNQLFAFFAVGAADVGRGVAEEVGHFDAGDRHGALEGEEDAVAGALIGFHFQNVVRGRLRR